MRGPRGQSAWFCLVVATSAAVSAPSRAEPDPCLLTLKDCLNLSLRNSMELEVTRVDRELASSESLAERGLFFPSLAAKLSGLGGAQPTSHAFQNEDPAFSSVGLGYGVGVAGRLPLGTEYRLSAGSDVLWSDQTSVTLSPGHANSIRLELVQPVLAGTGWDNNLGELRIAHIAHESVSVQLRLEIAELLTAVVRAYWQLVASHEELTVVRQSLGLAQDLRRATEVRVRLGNLSRHDQIEAEAAVAAREQEVASAEKVVLTAERALLQTLLGGGETRAQLDRLAGPLVPTDRPGTALAEERRPLGTLIERAHRRRPELEISGLAVKAQRIGARVAANRALPKLDLKASLQLGSLAGTARNLDGSDLSDQLEGNHWDAWKQVFTAEYPSVQVGLSLDLPLSSATRRREAVAQRLELRRRQLLQAQQRSKITLEVRDALRNLLLQRRRVLLTEQAVELARRNLDAADKKFKGGFSTSFDVLRVQFELARERKNAIQARKEFEVWRVLLARTTGDILEYLGVRVAGGAGSEGKLIEAHLPKGPTR